MASEQTSNRLGVSTSEASNGLGASTSETSNRLGVSTSEAARQLGVSLGTVRRWADMGHLRVYRTPGGQRRFSAESLDQFVASLEQDSPAAAPVVRRAS